MQRVDKINYNLGILSFWNVPNYGTFAQAYALQRICEAIHPELEPKQIAYLNEKHYKSYYSWRPPYSIKNKKFFIELPQRINPWSKYNKKKKIFLEAYSSIAHTDNLSEKYLEKINFDTLVLGSDIIWDYSFEIFNQDKYLFGNDLQAKKIVSYATSFGRVKAGSLYPEYVKTGLKNIKHISVRDENSANIVEEILGERPPIVLDPTWLWNFLSDPKLKKPKYCNYMVIYGQDFSLDFIIEIKKYAKRKKLLLICLDCNNDCYTWCDIVFRQYQLTPYEWLGFFKYADFIATSTFHGLTFGLIFNKKLAFCQSKFILTKAERFLKDLGLYELYTSEPAILFKNLENHLNYGKINSIIDYKREFSIAYLKKALREQNE